MTYPVLLFVNTYVRADMIQRQHDPKVVKVLAICIHPGIRGSSVLIEYPRGMTIAAQVKYDEFMAWVPSCLPPGERSRITVL